MKRVLTLKSAFAFLLAVIIFRLCFTAPVVKADRDVAHNVDLLLVYDKSYEAFMHNGYNITNYGERVKQIAMLGEVPFSRYFNIQFNVTTGAYLDYLGVDPALSCDSIYHTPSSPSSVPASRKVWFYNDLCTCAGLSHSEHHTRANYYTDVAHQYAFASNTFDDVGIIKAHSLCKTGETPVGGMAKLGTSGFIFDGKSGFVNGETNPEQFYNILYTKYYFTHEISHNFGAGDGYSNAAHCTENEPCTMNKGFHFIVYASKAWCSRCCDDIDATTFD